MSLRLSAASGTSVIIRPNNSDGVAFLVESVGRPGPHVVPDIVLTTVGDEIRLTVGSEPRSPARDAPYENGLENFPPNAPHGFESAQINQYSQSCDPKLPNNSFLSEQNQHPVTDLISHKRDLGMPNTLLSSLTAHGVESSSTAVAIPHTSSNPIYAFPSPAHTAPGYDEFAQMNNPRLSYPSSGSPATTPSLHTSSFPCEYPGCRRVFKRKYTLQQHESKHVEIFCSYPGCETKFKRNHDRMRHEHARHGKVSNLCVVCNKIFVSKQNLRKHLCTQSAMLTPAAAHLQN